MKIAALWIAKNEEETLGRSIKSVRDVADEMIVVDTGSTDNTVDVARQMGARVEHFEWINDFAAARNYAIQQTDCDIIIFLDADEWFVPALKKSDGKVMERAFSNQSVSALIIRFINIDMDRDIILQTDKMVRVFRGRGAVRYTASIHEHLVRCDGGRLDSVEPIEWCIHHSGYNEEQSQVKQQRNFDMLLSAIQSETDEMQKLVYRSYIVREAFNLNKYDIVSQNLYILLEKPNHIKRLIEFSSNLGDVLFISCIRVANICREDFSRRNLRKNMLDAVLKCYGTHPISAIAELYFDTAFNFSARELLKELPAQATKAEGMCGKETAELDSYYRAMTELYALAGEMAWLWGDRESAFDYATKALQQKDGYLPDRALLQLLKCVKGLPAEDIILYFNSILSIEKEAVRQCLLSSLLFEGYTDLYIYYLKKAIDAGTAKRSNYWYLMIAMGKAAEAAASIVDAKNSTEEETVQQILFLAIICSDDRQVYQSYRQELVSEYAAAADAFYDALPNQDLAFSVATDHYLFIAFAAGRPLANRFLLSLQGFEQQALIVQGEYYKRSGLYAEFISEVIVEPLESNVTATMQLAECHIMCENYSEALALLKTAFQHATLNFGWFNLLDLIAQKADEEPIRAEAHQLYQDYYDDYQTYIDYKDIVNTGLMIETDTKKQRKEIASMTEKIWDANVKKCNVPSFVGQIDVLRKVAAIYQENKSYAAALACYQKLIQLGVDDKEMYSELAALFTALDNNGMSRLMIQKSER